jgi:ATP-dependent DNA helicase RecQ
MAASVSDSYIDILKKYWGYDSFRGIQQEIIESIGAGRDTLGLMPTGGGKSITFQVPALAQEGTCIVVTPLIALMNDQVANLRKRGIRAAAIHSGLSSDEIITILENAVFGAVKLLYVSPERLSTDLFLQKVKHIRVSFICVDEAHCISQWGYDFRPSYLAIADIRKHLPGAPVLALTATATPDVVGDIQRKLLFKHTNVFKMSFGRKNLAYIVKEVSDKEQQMLHILDNTEGSAIVYTRSRMRTKELADYLSTSGHQATFFHAGLDIAVKNKRQKDWQEGRTRIMVATNAFGMGIDKPDVRTVIHADCPDSLEAYFQEAGRAGRDGKDAYAVLLFNGSDSRKLIKRIDDTFPPKEEVRLVYDHLAYFFQLGVGAGRNAIFEFPIERFCHYFHHFPTRVEAALKILKRAGYVEYSDDDENRSRVRFILERDDLYRLHDNTPDEEKAIVALLRNYTGLFNDYSYIDESLLAEYTGLTRPQLYLALRALHTKHVISYIPSKSIPLIRYLQNREDSEHLSLPPAVYDDLKERFTRRINKMLEYATAHNKCRSRMLLRYFGEESSKDCGICDVCQDYRGQHPDSETARAMIIELLSDGKSHPVSELLGLKADYQALDCALKSLTDEEEVIDDDGLLSLPQH